MRWLNKTFSSINAWCDLHVLYVIGCENCNDVWLQQEADIKQFPKDVDIER